MKTTNLTKIALAISAISILFTALNLGRESLWLDEIFTHHFAALNETDLSVILQRGMEGVHPPFYYLIIHYWAGALTHAGIDFASASRGLSLVFAMMSVIAIVFFTRNTASRTARALTVALIVTSGVWVYFAQEARSYALVQFLILMILFSTHSIASGAHAFSLKRLSGFVVLCAVTSVLHLYATIISGGAYFVLLMAATRFRDRFLVSVGGLIILVTAVAAAKWTSEYTVIPPEDNWVKNSFFFVLKNLLTFLAILIIPYCQIPPIALSVVAFIRKQLRAPNSDWRQGLVKVENVAGLIFLFALSSSIIASVFVTPIFTFKLSFVLAPLFWVILLKGVEAALQFERPKLVGAVMLISTALSALLTHAPFAPAKEDWRGSSEFVASLQECVNQPIPVVVHEAEVAGKPYTELFYGFYLEETQNLQAFSRSHLKLLRSEMYKSPHIRQLAEHAKNIASGVNPCPIVLWDGHNLSDQTFRSIRSVLHQDVPQDWKLTIQYFEAAPEIFTEQGSGVNLPIERWGLGHLAWGQARILLLEKP